MVNGDDMIDIGVNGNISIVICTFNDPIDIVHSCIYSLLDQDVDEIVIVDSSTIDNIKNYVENMCNVLKEDNDGKIDKPNIRYIRAFPKTCLSEARNIGISESVGNIIAFTDTDCIIHKNWAKNIYDSFKDKNIAVVGGKVLAIWLSKKKMFSRSTIAQGFYSLFDMGEQLKPVDQIFGCNFAINKSLLTREFGSQLFSTDLGRRGKELISGEESKLCKDVIDKNLNIIYNPNVVVWHQIPKKRTTFGWMWKRMYFGGFSRSAAGGKFTPRVVNKPYNVYDIIFLSIFIIPYVCGYIKSNLRKIGM